MALNLLLSIDKTRMIRDLIELSHIGRTPEGGVTRLAFSAADQKARSKVKGWMINAGLKIREDLAGNIIGTRKGQRDDAPAIMTGSHLDTVPNGGCFDGTVGVLGGLEAIRSLNQANVITKRPIQLVIFAGEEPNPFGFSTYGSRAMVGDFPLSWLERTYRNIPFSQVLKKFGVEAEGIPKARVSNAQVAGFLELHIEQGSLLEKRSVPIGIVSVLNGIDRFRIQISGKPNHAGTTPMDQRKDALTAASKIVLALESICRTRGEEVVGTVGALSVEPNQANVVPGWVQLEVETRSSDQGSLNRIKKELEDECATVQKERGVGINFQSISREPPISISKEIVKTMSDICHSLSIPYLIMQSWAGHDANHMAKITKTGVIFVPSKGGISHCPEEWTDEEHLEWGVRVLAEGLVRLANQDGGG